MFVICDDEHRVIGYVAIENADGEAEWTRPVRYMKCIVLDQAHQAKGIGPRALTGVLLRLQEQGVRTVYWKVRRDNEPGRKLSVDVGAVTDTGEETGKYRCYVVTLEEN